MRLPFPLRHLTMTSGRGGRGSSAGAALRVSPPHPGFPVPRTHCHPTRAAPCQPLTVVVGLPPPAARWRWQLKISSARLRYCVIFRFTASRRSLLGSTADSAEGGREGPAVPHPLAVIPGGIIESLRLEKTSKIIKSNHQLNTRMPAKPCPEVPYRHVF